MRNLNLLVLRCASPSDSARFYSIFDLTFEEHRHGSGPMHFGHSDSNGTLELYPLADGQAPDSAGLGFTISGLEQCRDGLLERGFEPGPIETHEWGETFVVRDPDGRRVEVQREL